MTDRALPQSIMASIQDTLTIAATLCGARHACLALRHSGNASIIACCGLEQSQLFAPGLLHLVQPFEKGFFYSEDLPEEEETSNVPVTVGLAPARFFAGVRLNSDVETNFGAFCVFDSEPLALSAGQKTSLLLLGHQCEKLLFPTETDSARASIATSTSVRLETVIPEDAINRSILNNISDVINVIDTEGRIKYVSPSLFQILGYLPEELIGTNTFNTIHPDDVAIMYEWIKVIISSESASPTQVFRHRHKDGSWCYVEAIGRSLLNNTSIQGILICSRDVTERRNAEQRLRLLESVVVNARDAVLITEADTIDSPGPKIVYANKAMSNMTGYLQAELIGKNPRVFQGPRTNRNELKRIKASMVRWEPIRIELINYRKDQEEYNVELDIVPVTDDRGWFTHFISIQRDITERKRSENSVKMLMSGARCLLWQGLVEDTGAEFLKWNIKMPDEEASQRFLPVELAPDQAYADAWRTSRVSEDLARTDKFGSDEVRNNRSYRQEFRCRRADGTIRWMSEDVFVEALSPKLWRAIGVCTDISDRIAAELELKQSEARYQSLVENVPVSVYQKNKIGAYTYGNETFCKYVGIESQELFGKVDSDIYSSTLALRSLETDKLVFQRQAVYDGTEEQVNDDGRITYMRVFKTPVLSADGEIIGTQGIFWDVTEPILRESSHKRRADLIYLLEKLALATNENTTFELASQTCLSLICDYTGSEVGHVLYKVVDTNGDYQLKNIWSNPSNTKYDEFKHVTQELAEQNTWEFYASMLKVRAPYWLTDISKESGFQRKQVAMNVGLNSMFAFPVDISDETMAMFEFISTEKALQDDMLIEVLETIGGLIGRVLEREILAAKQVASRDDRELFT